MVEGPGMRIGVEKSGVEMFFNHGKVVSTEYVLRRFNNDACPALKGKPKFFVLQACRGDEVK